jgi:cyclohexanone monooxygenase
MALVKEVVRMSFRGRGRDGERLSSRWAGGMRTLHGIYVRGFPNAFIVQPFQGGT